MLVTTGFPIRLTLLSPDIVEAIIDGRAHSDLTLPHLLEPLPITWAAQRHLLRGVAAAADN